MVRRTARHWEPAWRGLRRRADRSTACQLGPASRGMGVRWTRALPTFKADPKGMATRKASGQVLTALADVLPELWGGSADLAESNNTTMTGAPSFIPEGGQKDAWPGGLYGRTLHFGIREHAMGAALNGIALQSLTRPYGGTFLCFSDYMRPAVRLAALMQLPAIYIWTHDSIGLGEDGPTHQPVEHLAALRAMPGLDVVRPADANEISVCWQTILEHTDRPAGLILSRQNLPVLDRGPDGCAAAAGAARGGYVLADGGRNLQVILIATGSEVPLALQARDVLEDDGIGTRVVSMPCIEWFAAQAPQYRDQVLPQASRPGSASKPASPPAGNASSATPDAASASNTSARPPTTKPSTANSASPPTPSSRPRAKASTTPPTAPALAAIRRASRRQTGAPPTAPPDRSTPSTSEGCHERPTGSTIQTLPTPFTAPTSCQDSRDRTGRTATVPCARILRTPGPTDDLQTT